MINNADFIGCEIDSKYHTNPSNWLKCQCIELRLKMNVVSFEIDRLSPESIHLIKIKDEWNNGLHKIR